MHPAGPLWVELGSRALPLPDRAGVISPFPSSLWGSLEVLGEDRGPMAALPTPWHSPPSPHSSSAGKQRMCPSPTQSWGPIQPRAGGKKKGKRKRKGKRKEKGKGEKGRGRREAAPEPAAPQKTSVCRPPHD